MRVNAFEPTLAEIGDYNSIMANAYRRERERRASYFAKPVQKPVENKVIRLEKPIVEPRPREAETKYVQPIQGPCLPDHPKFPFYNGERDIIEIKSCPIKVADIIQYICMSYKVSKLELLSHRRTAAIVEPRHRAAWLCRKYTMRSLPEIGRMLGGRDHTSILFAVRKNDAIIAAGQWTPPTVEEILARVRSSALCAENAG